MKKLKKIVENNKNLIDYLKTRFFDLDDYIKSHYVEEIKDAEENTECVSQAPKKKESKSGFLGMSLSKMKGAAKRDSYECAFEERAYEDSECKFAEEEPVEEDAVETSADFADEDAEEYAANFDYEDEPVKEAPHPCEPGSMMMGAKAKASMAFASAMQAPRQRSLDDVVKNLEKNFIELVFAFADQKGFTDVEVQKKANIDRKAFSKLKCGTTKKPSKSTALAFAIALELNLDETRDLLSRAGYALSPSIKQDVIVQYFIEKEAYDIYEINEVLAMYGEAELGAKVS